MKKDVLILFEHKNRELESAILLKHKLERLELGCHVKQVEWSANITNVFGRYKVIVTPWCYDNKDMDFLCSFRGTYDGDRIKIVNLHCEQIGTNSSEEFLMPGEKAKGIMHYCWGEYYAELLRKYGVSDELIMITGSPRLDFFKEQMRFVSKTRVELSNTYNLKLDKKWVLFIGNYSGAFITDEQVESLYSRGYTEIKNIKDVVSKTYDITHEWLKNLCEDENLEIIYRPHPSEPESEEMLKMNNELSNFHVIKELAIRDWIINCDFGITWQSTSAVEAALGGLPIISIRPVPVPEVFVIPLIDNVIQVKSLSELKDVMENPSREKHKEVNAKLNEVLDFYYANQEELAADIMADNILKIMEDDSIPAYDRVKLSFLRKIILVVHYIGRVILHKIGVLDKIDKYKTLCSDYVSKKDMRILSDKIKEGLN